MQQINRLLSSSAGLVSETHLLVCSLSEATAGVCAESVTISCSSGVVSLLTVSIEPDNHILIQGSVLKEQNNPLTRCIRHENIAAPCAIFLSLPLWNTFCLLCWYFLIQRGELMVYFDRTRTDDLWRTNQKCFGEYFFSVLSSLKCVFPRMKWLLSSLVQLQREFKSWNSSKHFLSKFPFARWKQTQLTLNISTRNTTRTLSTGFYRQILMFPRF